MLTLQEIFDIETTFKNQSTEPAMAVYASEMLPQLLVELTWAHHELETRERRRDQLRDVLAQAISSLDQVLKEIPHAKSE